MRVRISFFNIDHQFYNGRSRFSSEIERIQFHSCLPSNVQLLIEFECFLAGWITRLMYTQRELLGSYMGMASKTKLEKYNQKSKAKGHRMLHLCKWKRGLKISCHHQMAFLNLFLLPFCCLFYLKKGPIPSLCLYENIPRVCTLWLWKTRPINHLTKEKRLLLWVSTTTFIPLLSLDSLLPSLLRIKTMINAYLPKPSDSNWLKVRLLFLFFG